MSRRARRTGLTCADCLVVIGVTGLLGMLLFPALQNSRETERRTQCKNNLKVLGLAMHNYHDAHGVFPPGMIDDNNVPTGGLTTGFTILLPFIEEVRPYNWYNFHVNEPPTPGWEPNGKDEPPLARASELAGGTWSHVANATALRVQVALFFCPSNRPDGIVQIGKDPAFVAGATDYGMCTGAIATLCGSPAETTYLAYLGGCFTINSRTRIRDFKDGTSNTIVMGEVAGGENWTATADHTNYQPADATALDGRAGPPGPRPWGVDQGWGVAWMQSGRENGPHPRGSIFFAAAQHVGQNLKIDDKVDASGDTTGDFPAPMNPRLLRQARIQKSGAALRAYPYNAPAGSNTRCLEMSDRLPEARSAHEGFCYFLMGDGTVREIKETVDRRVYGYVCTIRGADTVDDCCDF